MIGKLKGRIDSTGPDWAMVDVAGVCYFVSCSGKTLGALPAVGEAAEIYTDMLVSQDNIRLVGFATVLEKEWFKLLQTVQGVGARVALAILTVMSPGELGSAIALQDKAMIWQEIGGTHRAGVEGQGTRLYGGGYWFGCDCGRTGGTEEFGCDGCCVGAGEFGLWPIAGGDGGVCGDAQGRRRSAHGEIDQSCVEGAGDGMKRVFSTIWKTLLIWPACCGILVTVFFMLDEFRKGRFIEFVTDRDLVLVPLFAYVLFFIPAIVTGIAFSLIGILHKSLPRWSVPISVLPALAVLLVYEFSIRHHFEFRAHPSDMIFYPIMAIPVSTACSYVVWRAVRKHWNEFATR
jgi:hypothetical protein